MAKDDVLMDLIRANTAALEKVAAAVEDNAKKNRELGQGMRHLVGTIQGAQRLVGGELGPIIEKSKASAKKLHEEAEAAVRARDGRGN